MWDRTDSVKGDMKVKLSDPGYKDNLPSILDCKRIFSDTILSAFYPILNKIENAFTMEKILNGLSDNRIDIMKFNLKKAYGTSPE